ncbi:Ig-like domain-containing protein [Enterobacter asburiae]|uniref:Ig-like domain-containing protein n=1 Tax=Enterobacter asburiae TaxID=61645 RepID=UPI0020058FE6|nr:Ig-like domain-containing protein [Enterobacter asburiae]MCK7229464.1 Ig-like domain-containing protein [Enterobacter asburiae]
MSDTLSAGSSLIFYTGKNYAGSAQQITHGVTGVLAGSSSTWDYLSVALSAMESYVFSTVNTADTTMSYLGHVEAVISVSQADLTLLYPSSDQFPLNYLGLDPAQAAVVWLDVNATQAVPNAVASTALPGGGTTTLTTLSLPGRPGALGFVAKTEGSSVVASCRYGDYNTANGTVAWRGTGTLILEYTGGVVTLINGGGFPAGWTFSQPQLRGDGSWAVTLDGGVPASDTISSVTANPASIVDDGVSRSVITATVLNSQNQPAGGVTVSWSTTLGTVTPGSSVTDVNGLATATLTDSGAPGTATVTASITGSSRSTDVTVTAAATGAMLYQTMNYSGTCEALPAGSSTLLRNPLYQWGWQSVRPGNNPLLGHTLVGDLTGFDFRTYRDSYDAADNPDLTANYPVVAGAAVQGTSLESDDVVVRVTLVPSDRSHSVVAAAQQAYPGSLVAEYLASVTNGALTQSGVLVVMNKNQGLRTFPLLVGTLDTATGQARWSVSTSLIATWNETTQLPEVTLGSDAPNDWTPLPPQATDKAGEFDMIISGIQTGWDFNMYCVTDAPTTVLQTGAFNPIGFHGTPGASITVTVTGSGSVTTTNPVILDSSGYGRVDVAATAAETITVTAQCGLYQKTGTMRFVSYYTYKCDGGADHVYQLTQNAPSDGKTPNMIYSNYHNDILNVDGNAILGNGTNTITITDTVISLSVFDSTSETVSLTENSDPNVHVGKMVFIS